MGGDLDWAELLKLSFDMQGISLRIHRLSAFRDEMPDGTKDLLDQLARSAVAFREYTDRVYPMDERVKHSVKRTGRTQDTDWDRTEEFPTGQKE